MRTKIILLLMLAILILPILSTQAESLVGGDSAYTLSWYTIGGGGSTFGSADNYTLSSTIGQPDAGTYNGDPYTLSSGFWARPMTEITPAAHQIYLPLVIN